MCLLLGSEVSDYTDGFASLIDLPHDADAQSLVRSAEPEGDINYWNAENMQTRRRKEK